VRDPVTKTTDGATHKVGFIDVGVHIRISEDHVARTGSKLQLQRAQPRAEVQQPYRIAVPVKQFDNAKLSHAIKADTLRTFAYPRSM
jgi:hypothetical protein